MRQLLAFLLLVPLTAVAQVPNYLPTEGLVLFMDFDGDVDDNSGAGNSGTPYGIQYTENRFGIPGMAAEFGSNKWIEISHSSSINFALGDSLTWSIWIQTAPSSVGQTLFHKWNGIIQTTSYPLEARCSSSGESISSRTFCVGNQSNHGYVSNPVGLGEWTHALMTQTPDSTFLYVNGVKVDTGIITQSGCSNNTSLTIGRKFGVYPRYFFGNLDDFGIWNRVLTEEEISAIYSSDFVLGCTDPLACNYESLAVYDTGNCILAGCLDDLACNYNADAGCDDGNCDYSCCPGPGCCHDGTHWDITLEKCIVTLPTDVDVDGCTGVSDVLEILVNFGTCLDDLSPDNSWTCGDPLEYWDYAYGTVLLDEKCWFAENLKTVQYSNGDSLLVNLPDSLWSTTEEGATSIYGEGSTILFGGVVDVEAVFDEFGRLYNWYAVTDSRGLCPPGWSPPSQADFISIQDWASSNGIDSIGVKLRSSTGWNGGIPGTDDFGFGWKGSGNKLATGQYNDHRNYGHIQVSNCPCSADTQSSWIGFSINPMYQGARMGRPARCVKD